MKYYTVALKNLDKPIKDSDMLEAASVEKTGQSLIFRDDSGHEIAHYDIESVVSWRELPDAKH